MKKVLKTLLSVALTVTLLSGLLVMPASAEVTTETFYPELVSRDTNVFEVAKTGADANAVYTATVKAGATSGNSDLAIDLGRDYAVDGTDAVKFIKVEMTINANDGNMPVGFRIGNTALVNSGRDYMYGTASSAVGKDTKYTFVIDLAGKILKVWYGDITSTTHNNSKSLTITTVRGLSVYGTVGSADSGATISGIKQTNYSGDVSLAEVLDFYKPKTVYSNPTMSGVDVVVPNEASPVWGASSASELPYAKLTHVTATLKNTSGSLARLNIKDNGNSNEFLMQSAVAGTSSNNGLPELVNGREYKVDVIFDGPNKTAYYYVDGLLCGSKVTNATAALGKVRFVSFTGTVTNAAITTYNEMGSSNNWDFAKVEADVFGGADTNIIALNYANIVGENLNVDFYGNVATSGVKRAIVAVYNNEVLKSASSMELLANGNMVLQFEEFAVEEGDTVKVFLWNFAKLAPLMDAVDVNLQ